MPATEQTWRHQKTLHIVFAVSAAVMLIATAWMMLADHFREWKDWQLKDRKKEAWMVQSRHDALAAQYESREKELQDIVNRVDSSAIDKRLIDEFKATVREADAAFKEAKPTAGTASSRPESESPAGGKSDSRFAKLDELVEHLGELAEEARAAEANAGDAAASAGKPAAGEKSEGKAVDAQPGKSGAPEESVVDEAAKVAAAARGEAAAIRQKALAEMNRLIREALRRENDLIASRKTINGVRTAAVSELGLKIGEGAAQNALDEVQGRIDSLDAQIADLTDQVADAKDRRLKLESIVARIDADKADEIKDLATMKTNLSRLEEQVYKSTSNMGERFTRLPIVNALYSGNIKVEQNWLPDMTINYNFAQVARFDRCTTCHRGISTTAPDTATDPLYPTIPDEQRDVTVSLATPDEQPQTGAKLLEVYGMALSESGIIEDGDVTVHYVLPDTLAARAGIESGDVIRAIDGSAVASPKAAEQWLLEFATWGKPASLTLRRGLDHPFTTHPRLDLYLSDLSPHPQKVVGCTICHDGQGSGTSFKWTSHTPDNAREQEAWASDSKLQWFDNHHWIFPMKPARFIEANCLKCHHQKGSLEPSERFPEPPAPKLVEGWTLVEQYGCFGCHDINGYDGPKVTVGPDVRLEPPYHEAAAQILRDQGLSDEQRRWATSLVARPDDVETRRQLMASIKQDGELADSPETKDEAKLGAETHRLANVLKDIDIPGAYRKVGPSLRYLDSKVEYDWLYSWIRKPADFRPTTKMPQFFLQYEHLADDPDQLELSQKFEPIEIRALAEYLLRSSSKFDYLPAADGVTEKPSADRGKWLFESRGCLACHSHEAFPGIHSTQGPELSRVGSKLNNDKGRKWLYSWLKAPNHYHARTKMPDLYLEPIDEKDSLGKATGKITDPAADIAAFLLTGLEDDWRPTDIPQRGEFSDTDKTALADLAELWLASDAIPKSRARDYLQGAGIPKSQEAKLKTDERLLVGLTDENRTERQLQYVARRTISKYGCFGCHDIPGFEDAKPIGTGLVDWGRKDTSKLAFENIHKFLETHGIAPPNPANGNGEESTPSADAHADEEEHAAAHDGHLNPADFTDEVSYFIQSLNNHGRDGFLWQKLRYPRSYDYKMTRNKNFNERLRMPRFPFNDGQREAIMTFVLGLTKEPPADKYLYKPDASQQAILNGREVIEKFNCTGCHTFSMEQWRLAYSEGTFDDPVDEPDFPFLAPHFTEEAVAASMAKDYAGRLRAELHGEPVVDAETGEKFWVDVDRAPITKEELIEAEAEEGETIPVFYQFTLWRNVLLNGKVYLRGVGELLVPADRDKYGPSNGAAYPAWGGDLARYLFSKVVERAKQANPQLNAKEAWGWLPPPLMDEGWKVQPNWLHSFLMDPYPIRPAAVLRMPNFHMSSADAAKLVDFFAASSDAPFPYEYNPNQQPNYLTNLRREKKAPFSEAMNIVTNGNYCVKCHAVADFVPQGDAATFGPNLADVYRRLRPEFARDWIANPARILHYTGMPKNIPYYPDKPHLGGVDQSLFKGTSIQQVMGLVDLLMNFDAYAREQAAVTPQVEASAAAAKAQAAATGPGSESQSDVSGETSPP